MKNLVILFVVFAVFCSAVPVFAQMTVSQMAMTADDGRVSEQPALRGVIDCEKAFGKVSNPSLRQRRLDRCVAHNQSILSKGIRQTSVAVPISPNVGSTDTKITDLAKQEAMRVFLEKGFKSASSSDTADFVANIRTAVKPRFKCPTVSGYRRRCYSDPERVVYITLEDKNDVAIAVGDGDDRDFLEAVKEAAENAANKIKEEGKLIYIFNLS